MAHLEQAGSLLHLVVHGGIGGGETHVPPHAGGIFTGVGVGWRGSVDHCDLHAPGRGGVHKGLQQELCY